MIILISGFMGLFYLIPSSYAFTNTWSCSSGLNCNYECNTKDYQKMWEGSAGTGSYEYTFTAPQASKYTCTIKVKTCCFGDEETNEISDIYINNVKAGSTQDECCPENCGAETLPNPIEFTLEQGFFDTAGGGVFVHDVDSDGLMDFVFTSEQSNSVGWLQVYDHWGNKLWSKTGVKMFNYMHHPSAIAGDMDGDGKQEVAYLTTTDQIKIVNGATGVEKKTVSTGASLNGQPVSGIGIVNLRGVGDRDVVVQYKRIGHYSTDPLKAINLETGAVLWTNTNYIGTEHNIFRQADMDGDGKDEIGGVVLIDHDGTKMNTWNLQNDLGTDIYGIDSMVIADVYYPGVPYPVSLTQCGNGRCESGENDCPEDCCHTINNENTCINYNNGEGCWWHSYSWYNQGELGICRDGGCFDLAPAVRVGKGCSDDGADSIIRSLKEGNVIDCCSCYYHSRWCGYCGTDNERYTRPKPFPDYAYDGNDRTCLAKDPKYCHDVTYFQEDCGADTRGKIVSPTQAKGQLPNCKFDHDRYVLKGVVNGATGIKCDDIWNPESPNHERNVELLAYFHGKYPDDENYVCCYGNNVKNGLRCLKNSECKSNYCNPTNHVCAPNPSLSPPEGSWDYYTYDSIRFTSTVPETPENDQNLNDMNKKLSFASATNPLEVVLAEQGGNMNTIVVNKDRIAYGRYYRSGCEDSHAPLPEPSSSNKVSDPDKVAVGNFHNGKPGLEVFARSACARDPWVIDTQGERIASWRVDNTKPSWWTDYGIEEVCRIDWDGDATDEIVAVERDPVIYGSGAIINPINGQFKKTFQGDFMRIYAADILGDYREEVIVVDWNGGQGNKVKIFWNSAANTNSKPSYWSLQHYARQKQNWNYYSP